MIEFLPGRLHERLWWVIGIATTLKCILGAVLLAEIVRGGSGESLPLNGDQLGGRLRSTLWAEQTASFAWLRTTWVMTFATAWVIVSGADAAGLRLASMLQDGFFWTLIATVLLGCYQRGRPRTPTTTIA